MIDEDVRNTSLIVLADDVEEFLTYYCGGIANWKFAIDILDDSNAIRVSSVEDYKGLEADMVIYIHKDGVSDNLNYVAYTRAKYYLLELVLR